MDYSEVQDDRIESAPSAGQTIPYEDYSAATTTEEEEGGGTTEHSMRPQSSSKGAHKKKTTKQQHNARPPRKRSSSSISSSSSSDSSSSSSIFSSSDDNSGASDGDDDRSAGKKKKGKKKAAATSKKQPSSSSRGGQQQTHRRGGGTDTADDGSINKLISVALKSQKKQYKNQIIQSVKSDLMNTLRSRIVQQQQRGKKATKDGAGGGGGGDYDDEDDGGETTVGVDSSSTDKQYRKRIKQAYKEHEEGYDDAPKFNSKHHKKTIGSILSKLGEVNDIELFCIPHIDKEMGLDRMEISARDTKLSKKMLSASPEKTIPEAVYAALKDAYSSCMLYKYFFRRIFPYITVPYITSK